MHINITIVYRLERADKNRLVCLPPRDYRTTFRNNAVRVFFSHPPTPTTAPSTSAKQTVRFFTNDKLYFMYIHHAYNNI